MVQKINIHEVLKEMFSGYSFRSKVEHNPNGDLAVIQMKDLENEYQDIGEDLTRISVESVPEKYLLRQGDVLFLSKGANNKALVFDQSIKAVASSAFFVLRPDKHKIIPEYLAWFINQRETQKYIEENRAGTYIPNVNKATVLGIAIKLPPLVEQKFIAKIDFLRKREYLLTNELLAKREQLIAQKLLKKING